MPVRITCVTLGEERRGDRHLAIVALGWTDERTGRQGTLSREEMYRLLKSGQRAYVLDGQGMHSEVVPRLAPGGELFVQAIAEGRPTSKLLQLPTCAE
jgi:hypothetical protein